MSVLTCPICGYNSCPIFYGFTLVYPNFDSPKNFKIEIKFICTKNNDKMSSIDLVQYQKMIELNVKFNNSNFEEEEEDNIHHNINNKIINFSEIKKEFQQIDINAIINKLNYIIISNEKKLIII